MKTNSKITLLLEKQMPGIELYWKPYEPLIQALVELGHPFVEAAVHDLKEGKIIALFHNLSKRAVGDPSPLTELGVETKDFPDYFHPYYKKNWDGRLLKCISFTLRNEKKVPVGLICINVDVSFMEEAQKILETFFKIPTQTENPTEIKGTGFEEQIAKSIEQYLSQQQLSLKHLNRDHKREVVQHLFKKGIFHFKNAAPYVAQVLNISRASVYNYIRECD